MTMSPSSIINYAEQVLREEAERVAQLKEANQQVKKNLIEEPEQLKSSNVKVNLKDEDNFPTLGKAKGILFSCCLFLIIFFVYSECSSMEPFYYGTS